MKAAVYRRYGSPSEVVRIEEAETPVAGDGEVLIAVRAASINPLDSHLMKGKPTIARLALGLRAPKRTRPGVDLAGQVAAVGAGVTRFKVGDLVFGSGRGALAEFACAKETNLAAKPAGLSPGPPPSPSPASRRCRACATRPGSRRGRRCWSTARPAASAASRSRSPRRSARR
jgi:NADPH:quinone reductase-like Zn-dependent oxidoreductase